MRLADHLPRGVLSSVITRKYKPQHLQVVKALRYSLEGPGIDPRSLGIFFPGHQTVPCALGSTQPLKMITRIFLGVKTVGA